MKWTTKLHWGYLPLLVPLLGRRLTHIIKKKRERIHTKQLTEPSVEFSLSLTFFLLTSPFFFPRHLLAAVHRGDLNWIFLGFHHFLLGCKEFRGTADPISNVGHVAPEEMPNSVFSSAWKVKVELPSQWYRLRRTPIGPGLLRPSRHRITRRNRNSGTDCVTENSPVTWSMKTWKKKWQVAKWIGCSKNVREIVEYQKRFCGATHTNWRSSTKIGQQSAPCFRRGKRLKLTVDRSKAFCFFQTAGNWELPMNENNILFLHEKYFFFQKIDSRKRKWTNVAI